MGSGSYDIRAMGTVIALRLLAEWSGHDEDVDVDALLSDLVDAPASCGVLHVTEQDDVDFMVLVPAQTRLVPAGPSGRPAFDGLVEVVDLRRTSSDLARSMRAIAAALDEPTCLRAAPRVDGLGLRFLHRLRTGAPIRNEALVETWRDHFLVAVLPRYLALRFFMEMREHLEEAVAGGARAGSNRSALRLAAEKGVRSLLARRGGTTTLRSRLLAAASGQLEGATPEESETLAGLLALLSGWRHLSVETIHSRLDALQGRIAAELSKDAEIASGLRRLG
jgi:hypothetical protein